MKYAFVGLGSNLLLYMVYLYLTAAGMGHKSAVSALYLLGVLVTFLFNRGWTFGHGGSVALVLPRYVVVYLFAYTFNLILLYLFVDVWGFAHQVVQGVLILVIAILIFTAQKLWIFAADAVSIPRNDAP